MTAYTFTLDEHSPASPVMRVDVDGVELRIHTSAAQALVRSDAPLHRPTNTIAALMAAARCAFAQGLSASGHDGSAVLVTAPEPTLPGRHLGAIAWLHYSDDDGRMQCGVTQPIVCRLYGAANVMAAVIEGAAVCPRCLEAHNLGSSLARQGAEDASSPV